MSIDVTVPSWITPRGLAGNADIGHAAISFLAAGVRRRGIIYLAVARFKARQPFPAADGGLRYGAMAPSREVGQKSVEQVLEDWRGQGVRYVRFELPDMHGTSRSKTIPIEHCPSYAESGLNMYGGAVVLDSRSDVVSGTLYNEEIAYADQRLRPDPATAALVPWAEATGRMICDTFWDDGRRSAPHHVRSSAASSTAATSSATSR